MSRNAHIDYSDALHIPYGGTTLISPQFSKRALDMWVYVGVFGLAQGPDSTETFLA